MAATRSNLTQALAPMKLYFLFAISLVALGCASPDPRARQVMLVLPDGRVHVDGITSDVADAIGRLGPPNSVLVVVSGCKNSTMSIISKATKALSDAGYDEVGFATAEGPSVELCETVR